VFPTFEPGTFRLGSIQALFGFDLTYGGAQQDNEIVQVVGVHASAGRDLKVEPGTAPVPGCIRKSVAPFSIGIGPPINLSVNRLAGAIGRGRQIGAQKTFGHAHRPDYLL
jgi:hypothetical protein